MDQTASGRRQNQRPDPQDFGAGFHPDVEALVDYRHERLPTERREQVAEHVSLCDHCADLLLDLKDFEEDVDERTETGVADLRAERDVRALLAEMKSDRPVDRRPSERRVWVRAIAAGFFAVSLGLGLWVQTLRNEIRELHSPQLNVPIVNLRPVGSLRSGGETSRARAEGQRIMVILNPSRLPADVDHRIRLLEAESEIWSASGLRPTEVGNFYLELPRSLVPPGTYRLVVEPAQAATPTEVSEYRLEVVP